MFLTPDNPTGPDPRGNVFAMPAPVEHPGCNCGCHAQKPMGALFDGTGLFGTGLFASGLNLAGWGLGEWIAVGLGVFALYSMFSTTAEGARKVRRGYRYVKNSGKRRRDAQIQRLRDQIRQLERASA